ncbi:phytanoyl-CoA dioxygenase family protein [Tomitella fengzijianii]|uniref:Mitomycin antibiotic biosynthesis protein n=1 Tax=Tomitella fengzijianii TaxID=2597660 RepID=A0A516X353_9ACTN|nr:phytanoyl-CoA dioxygenase family protein [Tomitella fengzijianii]QDQ97500.1 mitomycin antibiotic biosynthesis protein [Tomitella fengzijianii]
MTALTHVSAHAPREDLLAALFDQGAVIVDGLLDPDLLARFNAELDEHLEDTPQTGAENFVNAGVAEFFGRRTEHLTGLAGKSRVFATEVLTHPVYRAVCDAALLPGCVAYQLNLAHVLNRLPGGTTQMLHRDEDVWANVPRQGHIQLASVVALRDFTAANGATRIIPGSHRWDRDRVPTDAETVPAEMPAGSGVIYLGSTIHGAGANTTTDQRRRGMHLSYCAGWLRTEENQYLSVPLDTVRGLPEESQRLLGFGVYDAIEHGGGYMGAVDLQDPVKLMAAGKL